MFNLPTMTQKEFCTYTHYVNELKMIEQSNRNLSLHKTILVEGFFIKYESDDLPPQASSEEIDNALKERISFINDVHSKLSAGSLLERSPDDCLPLAADFYNTKIKTMTAWNKFITSSDLHIQFPNKQTTPLHFTLSNKSSEQIADEKALSRYFELLKLHPKLIGEENSIHKGMYEIILDEQRISEGRKNCYSNLYQKAIAEGKQPAQAHNEAILSSRPGVVMEDQYWLWIRDVVISPVSLLLNKMIIHTYNRMIWKTSLNQAGGVAVLPIIVSPDGKEKKVVVEVAGRHATRRLEIEIPRGLTKPGETPELAAKRELKEETGQVVNDLVFLGNMVPDSGMIASIIPVYAGTVIAEEEANHDETEAIKGKYTFTVEEVWAGMERGYMEINEEGTLTRIPIGDSFIAWSMLMAQRKGLLDVQS